MVRVPSIRHRMTRIGAHYISHSASLVSECRAQVRTTGLMVWNSVWAPNSSASLSLVTHASTWPALFSAAHIASASPGACTTHRPCNTAERLAESCFAIVCGVCRLKVSISTYAQHAQILTQHTRKTLAGSPVALYNELADPRLSKSMEHILQQWCAATMNATSSHDLRAETYSFAFDSRHVLPWL